jgi:hypothetical protein
VRVISMFSAIIQLEITLVRTALKGFPAMATPNAYVCCLLYFYFNFFFSFPFIYLFVTALCGNGICQADLNENCVTCPLDCPDAFCGTIFFFSFSFSFILKKKKNCVET